MTQAYAINDAATAIAIKSNVAIIGEIALTERLILVILLKFHLLLSNLEKQSLDSSPYLRLVSLAQLFKTKWNILLLFRKNICYVLVWDNLNVADLFALW